MSAVTPLTIVGDIPQPDLLKGVAEKTLLWMAMLGGRRRSSDGTKRHHDAFYGAVAPAVTTGVALHWPRQNSFSLNRIARRSLS